MSARTSVAAFASTLFPDPPFADSPFARSARASFVALVALAVALTTALPASAQLALEKIADGLVFPTYAAFDPDDSSRMFILQREGQILLYENGSVNATPFLDLSADVLPDDGEQGLLGMDFHPDFSSNGHFYVYFIRGVAGMGGGGDSVIRRYTVMAGNPSLADPASAFQIWETPQPQTNHNGATIHFGPDGYLWIALGDGGTGGFRSQDLADPMGKVLRFDVDGDDFPADPLRNYAIPATGPFVGQVGVLEEIWAYGLRNPYRFSFDRLTNDLWIGDVGQHSWEEIDFQSSTSSGGENYGWGIMEGPECFQPPVDCNDGSLTLPIYAYEHLDGPCYSVTGGPVYRGSVLGPRFYGAYFWAEYCLQEVYSFKYDGVSISDFVDWTAILEPPGNDNLKFPAAIVEDPDGELYIVEYRASIGEVWKIVPDSTATDVPVATAAAAVQLSAAQPNPATGDTRWQLSLERAQFVKAELFDPAGRRVRTLMERALPAGRHDLTWNGASAAGEPAAAGVYFLRVETEGGTRTQPVTRLR